jgi:hypothetical protein
LKEFFHFRDFDWLSLKKAGIDQSRFFQRMRFMVFGSQLTILNDRTVTSLCERKKANSSCDRLLPELQNGKIITALSPLRFVNLSQNRSPKANSE